MVVMYNLAKLPELKVFLLSLTAYKGLHVYHTTITDELNAGNTAMEQKLDLDDAIQYCAALSANTKL